MIKRSPYFNDPAIGAAFGNLADAFAPPSAQDQAAYAAADANRATAEAKRQDAARRDEVYRYARDAGYDQQTADRLGVLSGLYAPNQSYQAVDTEAATARRGQDVNASTQRYGYDRTFEASRANNSDDNKRATVTSLFGPLNPGQVAPAVPDQFMSALGLPAVQERQGAPKPLSVDEVKAGELQKARANGGVGDRELMAAILGDPKLEQVQGPNGPTFARAVDAVGQRPATDVSKIGEQAGKLRGEVVQLPAYKNWAQAAPIYKSMLATADTNTRASDLNLIYATGKIMDPGSVVREGEQVMVANTAALPDWIVGAANRLNGGATLQPDTRAALLAEAHKRMRSYEDVLSADLDRYGAIADRSGIRRDDVLPTLERSKPYQRPAPAQNASATASPTVAPAGEDLPTPQSEAEYNALPSGARYRDPDDGKPYRKP